MAGAGYVQKIGYQGATDPLLLLSGGLSPGERHVEDRYLPSGDEALHRSEDRRLRRGDLASVATT